MHSLQVGVYVRVVWRFATCRQSSVNALTELFQHVVVLDGKFTSFPKGMGEWEIYAYSIFVVTRHIGT